jgi:alpha-galactosidase
MALPSKTIDSSLTAHCQWIVDQLTRTGEDGPPLSFSYGGHAFADLLAGWSVSVEDLPVTEQGPVKRETKFRDPSTGLAVRIESAEYRDFSAVEWTAYLQNDSTVDTLPIEDLQAIDLNFVRSSTGEYVLHHTAGSPALATDYAPRETILKRSTVTRITTKGGRPSDTDLPYFNLTWDGGGVVIALGWPGQWAARFVRDSATSVRVLGGQELTHFVLHPGEEVRGPLIALVFYQGDWIDGQNVWRHWILAHNLPRVRGELPKPFIAAASSNQFNEMEEANEANQILFVDRYLAEGIPLDYWWMDAGWYATQTGHWVETGTWEVDQQRFPRELKAITDHCHALGLKNVVWFEPERVAPGSWLDRHHPEWLLERPGARWKILDLGNDSARAWAIERFDTLIREQGVDLYRQDFNVAPLDYWRDRDAPDRQGISEIRHVTGYLAFWDELRRRHPEILLDTCASGGRRLDLETLRRSVPLHKSDHDYRDHAARLSQAYGIAFWIPFHGAPVCRIDQVDEFAVRCAVGMMVGLGYDVCRTDLDYPLLRKLLDEWQSYAHCYYGDYYPLTSYPLGDQDWAAWQYDRPDLGEGLVQVFRRAASPFVSALFRLRGLEREATYRVASVDDGESREVTGRAFLEEGIPVTLNEQPSSMVLRYWRL